MRKLPQLVDGQRPAIHKLFFRSGIRDEVLQELVQLFLLFEWQLTFAADNICPKQTKMEKHSQLNRMRHTYEMKISNTYYITFSSKSTSCSLSPSGPNGTGDSKDDTSESIIRCSSRALTVIGDVENDIGSATISACELGCTGALDSWPESAFEEAVGWSVIDVLVLSASVGVG